MESILDFYSDNWWVDDGRWDNQDDDIDDIENIIYDAGGIQWETGKAFWFKYLLCWLPKELIVYDPISDKVYIPRWLALDKNLI